MSKKKKGSSSMMLFGLLVIGVGLYFLLKRPRVAPTTQNFNQLPPAPPRNNISMYGQWASTIIQLFGDVAELWQPGGPFYGTDRQDIYDAIDYGNSNIPTDIYDNGYEVIV